MITLRTDPELEHAIAKAAHTLGISKSELVRRSVMQFLNNIEDKTPWELGHDLFAKYSSGNPALSTERKHLIHEKVHKKLQRKHDS